MSTAPLSASENYEIFKNEVEGNSTDLADFSEGSMLDSINGALSAGLNEVAELIVSEFMNTFFSTASGPTPEDPIDHLSDLAVDHFGELFKRPSASPSTGSETFSRASTDGGDCLIPVGTIIKTVKDTNGKEIRFKTTEEKTLVGLSISAQIEAVDPGASGQVSSGKITVLESTLTDPTVTVSNPSATAGGENAPDDATYREIIKNLILALAGATEAAVKGAILAVPGVAFADLIVINMPVIEFDLETMLPKVGETYFRIPYPVAYIADSEGNSSTALINLVQAAILKVRAAGVKITVKGAIPVTIDWSGSYALNPLGPNYAELSLDSQKITDTMVEYINKVLVIGDDFVRSEANAYILSIWGPAGTNDLTTFTTSSPVGDVSVASNQKTVAGITEIV